MTVPLLFLSHSGADARAAADVKAALLKAAGANGAGLSVWLDLDDLDEGQPWQAQLEDAMGRATACAVIVGSRGIQNWVRAEVDLAMGRAVAEPGFRFIPVLMGDATANDLTPFAKRFHAIKDPLRDSDALRRLLAAALGGEDQAGRPALTADPFPGLRSMDENWADRFFGRKGETEALIGLLLQEPIVSIVSDSGSGKSSLAMAGVGAAWRGGAMEPRRPSADDPVHWNVVTMRPKGDPIEGLKEAVTRNAVLLGREDRAAEFRRGVAADDPSECLYALECGLPAGQTRTLLIIDQAEELVTATAERALRARFGELVAGMLRIGGGDGRLRCLLTVRADYANLVEGVPGIGEHLSRAEARFRLKRPGPDDLREMVTGPIDLTDFNDPEKRDALADAIVADLSDRDGDLALAQMALHLVWRDRAKFGGSLLGTYAAIGGITGALGREAERVARDELSPDERGRLMPIFLRLVRLGETAGATRRIAPLAEFTPEQRRLIDRLASDACGRLLQVSRDTVEIAHEALIRQWPQLHQHVQDNVVDIRLLGELMEDADRWYAAGAGEGRLRRLGRLASRIEAAEYGALAGRRPGWISAVEAAFVRASQRYANLVRGFFFASVGVILGLAVVAVILFVRAEEMRAQAAASAAEAEASRVAAEAAREAADESRRMGLALLAQSVAASAPLDAIRLVLSSWPADAVPSAEYAGLAADAIYNATLQIVPQTLLTPERAAVRLAVLPDGRIAAGGRDGAVELVDPATGAVTASLPGHEGFVLSVVALSDGRLATGDEGGTLRLWNAETGVAELVRKAHGGAVRTIAKLPGGGLATGGEDGMIRLWDPGEGRETGAFDGRGGGMVRGLAAPGDGTLISAHNDGSLRRWDLATGETVSESESAHQGAVMSLALLPGGEIASGGFDGMLRIWSPDGWTMRRETMAHDGAVHAITEFGTARVVTAGTDGAIRIWDRATGRLTALVKGHTGAVLALEPLPDGRLASGGTEAGLRIWQPEERLTTAVLEGHEGPVRSVAALADGRIVSAGTDRTVQVWFASSGQPVAVMRGQNRTAVSSVATLSDGRVVTGGADGQIRILDPGTLDEIIAFGGGDDAVRQVAVLPDDRIVSGGADRLVRIWAPDGRELMTLETDDDPVLGVAANGDRIAAGGADGIVRVWDAATGRRLPDLKADGGLVRGIAWLGRERLISGSGDGTIRIWDVDGARVLSVLEGHGGAVWGVAALSDGRIASGGDDGTVRIWDAETGRLRTILGGHGGRVRSVTALPGGGVAVGVDDGTVRITEGLSDPGVLLRLACRMLPMTPVGRDLAVGGIAQRIRVPDLPPLAPCDDLDPTVPDGFMWP